MHMYGTQGGTRHGVHHKPTNCIWQCIVRLTDVYHQNLFLTTSESCIVPRKSHPSTSLPSVVCVCVNLLKTKHVQISNTPRFLLPFHSQSIFPNPSDTKISHPPRTYIKFLCRKDIEKGHPRSERCRTIGYTAVALQFLQPGCPTFQQTFGEPGRDEVLKVSQNPASFPWDFFLRLWHAMAIGLARDLYVYVSLL